MAKIKVGTIFGRNIYIGNNSTLKDGELFISTSGKIPTGLYIKSGGLLKQLCNCNKEEKEPNLCEASIMTTYHGKTEEVVPLEGYDGLSKVYYKKPRLENKDSIVITKNGVVEIKAGRNYDGLNDIIVIVNVENNE